MNFIFEDKNIATNYMNSPTKKISVQCSYIFQASNSGEKGVYIGRLEHLSPEPVEDTLRDYRFFDANGHQQSSAFKGEDFMKKTGFEEAKKMLEKSLISNGLIESNGHAIVKVTLEGVDKKVPFYLKLDRSYLIWSVIDTPSLIDMEHLKDIEKVLNEANRSIWFNIKGLDVIKITPDLF